MKENAVQLPTVNHYYGLDGGYVGCFSNTPDYSFRSIKNPAGGNFYLKGRIRLKGSFPKEYFVPDGYDDQDISALPEFNKLCANTFSFCQDCWAGGFWKDAPTIVALIILSDTYQPTP
ncbi:hypothetical protein [Parendozoicomonas sp. Alg238-R29]|uniref:hypothetical protein n=1 Tax=Parendozoicomonas sp. Alg238-R29 TaxID=2993446 RepID=UPI00248E81E1|nr:hypothetical protein [Parendozoicomonas sp. Alg238-R29]